MDSQDIESVEYVKANDCLSIHSKELRFLRRALRLFGFWHPVEASFMERIIYPLIINIFLLAILISETYHGAAQWKEHQSHVKANYLLQTAIGISRYVWAWLTHTLTIRYFKKRNLEKKLFEIEVQTQYRRKAEQMIRGLNWIIAVSLLISVITCSLSMVIGACLFKPSRWTANSERNHGKNISKIESRNQHEAIHMVLVNMISISDLYLAQLVVCLTWLMYLLSKTCQMRLLQLRNEYMSWNQQPEDAIFRHYTFYTKNVKSNCNELKYLFVSHNVLMIIITPLLFYLCVVIGKTQSPLNLVAFLYYFIVFLTFWITPLFLAESLRKEEDEFCNELNNFCPQYLALYREEETDEYCGMRTFSSRNEVHKIISYLKGRKPGFLVGCYSFQLQLSMVSFYIGLLMFILRLSS